MWEDLAISEDTKQMLNKLIEHQEKKESYLKKSRIFLICLCLFALSFVLHFYSQILLPATQRVDQVLDMLFADQLGYFLLVGTFALFITTNYHFAKHLSTKQKLDKLRAEVIDNMRTVWTVSHRSQLKDEISKRMKACGVNMSHKEK